MEDTGTTPNDYDLILTGDLGQVGSELLIELLNREGISIVDRHNDCGLMIYDREKQDVHAGGSGCGCSASILCGYILNEIRQERLNEVLFIATGALMAPTSCQKETCDTCGGDGRETCTFCHGTGQGQTIDIMEIPTPQGCAYCGSSGWRVCSQCNGYGVK